MIKIRDARGAKPKYNFDNFILGETRAYETASSTQSLLGCAKRYVAINELGWKFRCYKVEGIVKLTRVI